MIAIASSVSLEPPFRSSAWSRSLASEQTQSRLQSGSSSSGFGFGFEQKVTKETK